MSSLAPLSTHLTQVEAHVSSVVPFRRTSLDTQLCAAVSSREIACPASEMTSWIALLHAPMKEDVRRLLVLLERSVRSIRLLAIRISDPGARSEIERQITAIEGLIEIARGKASQL